MGDERSDLFYGMCAAVKTVKNALQLKCLRSLLAYDILKILKLSIASGGGI